MKKKFLYSIALVALSVTLYSYDLPKGWHTAGSESSSYDIGIDKGAGRDGKNVATIKSIKKSITGFGTLMQSSVPDKYLGKRVRMTGLVKSENVKNWAGLWFRVDQNGTENRLGFDNMENRPIKGTNDWKRYEIVLEVPSNASNLAYGALIVGTGQVWFDDIQFEIVDNSVSVTGSPLKILQEPQNLNFED